MKYIVGMLVAIVIAVGTIVMVTIITRGTVFELAGHILAGWWACLGFNYVIEEDDR